MKRKLKWIFGALLALFLAAQFVQPAHTNPPVLPGGDISATNPPPPEIAALLRVACYDCHSYETKWPWDSHIAPASWLIVSDVNDGRNRLNFSEWPHALPERAAKRLERVSEEVDYKDMPPGKYTLMHPAARLTDAQRQQLTKWADATAAKLKAGSTNAAD